MKRTRQLRDQVCFADTDGGVIEATIAMIREHGLSGDIVAISGDSGWKNMEKLHEHLNEHTDGSSGRHPY